MKLSLAIALGIAFGVACIPIAWSILQGMRRGVGHAARWRPPSETRGRLALALVALVGFMVLAIIARGAAG